MGNPIELQHLRILVAEDNMLNQEVTCRMIEKMGHEATVANNGREVLEALLKRPFDLILMDCHMPVIDGYDSTRFIRKSHWQDIPIIALTANAIYENRVNCLEIGMNDFITKPATFSELKTKIEDLSPFAWRHAMKVFTSIDSKTIDQLLSLGNDNEPTLLNKVIDIYLEIAPPLVHEIETTWVANDYDSLRRKAHSLRSSSGNAGALKLMTLCQLIELDASKGIVQNLESLIFQLKDEYGRVESELRKIRLEGL